MPTNAFGGWASGVNLQNLLNEAKLQARLANYNHLGADAAARNLRVADIVNRAIEEFLERNPGVGLGTANIDLVNLDNSYVIPTDLHGVTIQKVYFQDTGTDGINDLRELDYLSPAGVEGLPRNWVNGDLKDPWPQYWGYNNDASEILFYPTPDGTKDVTLVYRKEPTAITEANVASPGAVTVGEIPTRFQGVVALKIAAEFAKPIKPALGFELEARYSNPDPANPGEMEKTQKLIARVLGEWKAGQAHHSRHSQAINYDAIFPAGMLGGGSVARRF